MYSIFFWPEGCWMHRSASKMWVTRCHASTNMLRRLLDFSEWVDLFFSIASRLYLVCSLLGFKSSPRQIFASGIADPSKTTDRGTGCTCTVLLIVPGSCGDHCSRQFSDSPRCKHKKRVATKGRCQWGGVWKWDECTIPAEFHKISKWWWLQKLRSNLKGLSLHVMFWSGVEKYIITPGQGSVGLNYIKRYKRSPTSKSSFSGSLGVSGDWWDSYANSLKKILLNKWFGTFRRSVPSSENKVMNLHFYFLVWRKPQLHSG